MSTSEPNEPGAGPADGGAAPPRRRFRSHRIHAPTHVVRVGLRTRLTLTYAGIARGREVVVTVSGAEKAEAFDAVRRGVDVPASHIRAERVIWLVDPAAAGES